MSASFVSIGVRETPWRGLAEEIVVGKDILELLSSSMYVDPMTIYREYLQNAADAIDAAKAQNLLAAREGIVDIVVNQAERTVTITDNGVGLDHGQFTRRLTAFGGSTKRGTGARGFRGVGRLAGIGYCQELVFRTRASGDSHVSELRWDCKKLKNLLRASDTTDDLVSAVAQVVSIRRTPGQDVPKRFFEVELRGIVRHRNDQLLNVNTVGDYLSQVGPVPFALDFPHREKILNHLNGQVGRGDVQVRINGGEALTRPHHGSIILSPEHQDAITEIELVSIPTVDGGVGAVGWIGHHGYFGALPVACGIRGLRLRVGNIQVGDERLLEELFPETRFNVWSVGEIHILDRRVVPNGRRDHFEQNVHYDNVLTHLVPSAREITRRCRINSVQRKWVRDFELRELAIRENISILKQAAVTRAERQRLGEEIRAALVALGQIVNRGLLAVDSATDLRKRLEKLEREATRVLNAHAAPSPLAALPPVKRRVYEHAISLIYECSTNQATAKLLVDKIIARLK